MNLTFAELAEELGKEAGERARLVETYELLVPLVNEDTVGAALAQSRRRLSAISTARDVFQALARGGV